jgi:hypothetical protein
MDTMDTKVQSYKVFTGYVQAVPGIFLCVLCAHGVHGGEQAAEYRRFQPLLHSTRSALITGPAMHDRR